MNIFDNYNFEESYRNRTIGMDIEKILKEQVNILLSTTGCVLLGSVDNIGFDYTLSIRNRMSEDFEILTLSYIDDCSKILIKSKKDYTTETIDNKQCNYDLLIDEIRNVISSANCKLFIESLYNIATL